MKGSNVGIIIIYSLVIFLSIILPIFILPSITSTYLLVINPISWIVIAILSFFVNSGNRENISVKKAVIKSVTIVTLGYIILYYFSGLLFGFLKTPYSHSFEGISKNIFSMLLVVVLQEYVRYVLVNNSNKNKIVYMVISLLFILINIEWSNISKNFSDSATIFKYISSYIMPKTVESILCTYLVLNGTNLASTIYRGLITFGLIMFPVIPDLNWFFTGMATLLVSFFIFIKVNFELKNKDRDVARKDIKRQKPYKLIPFIAFLIICVCFVAGIFKYSPVAVLSNSMVPEFSRGDVVIIEKLDSEEIKNIKVGDIIEYKLQDRFVIHRVVVIVDSKNYIFKTKGDNNNAADAKLVKAEQIVGKVKFIVPLIGYPSVYFNQFLSNRPPDNIET